MRTACAAARCHGYCTAQRCVARWSYCCHWCVAFRASCVSRSQCFVSSPCAELSLARTIPTLTGGACATAGGRVTPSARDALRQSVDAALEESSRAASAEAAQSAWLPDVPLPGTNLLDEARKARIAADGGEVAASAPAAAANAVLGSAASGAASVAVSTAMPVAPSESRTTPEKQGSGNNSSWFSWGGTRSAAAAAPGTQTESADSGVVKQQQRQQQPGGSASTNTRTHTAPSQTSSASASINVEHAGQHAASRLPKAGLI